MLPAESNPYVPFGILPNTYDIVYMIDTSRSRSKHGQSGVFCWGYPPEKPYLGESVRPKATTHTVGYAIRVVPDNSIRRSFTSEVPWSETEGVVEVQVSERGPKRRGLAYPRRGGSSAPDPSWYKVR